MRKSLITLVVLLICCVLLPQNLPARMVHDFDCTFCHLDYTSEQVPYMTYNVCLDCHYPGNEGTTYQRSDGSTSNPITATFAAGDGSDAMGSNTTAADAETSHFFAGSSDNQPAAGATPPSNFRFNLGWANGQVTCSRCHNPHGDTSNPKLLKLGAGKTEAMCLDCHDSWNQIGNHGLGSHPMHADYPALAAANPDKFKATPDNAGTNGNVALVDEVKVSCSSCHGVHWTDSSADTLDSKDATLDQGDGKLLRFDGETGADPDRSICLTCHVYLQHGRSSGLGCQVCHAGHEYDAGGNPNYFILKKQVDLDPVPKTGAAGTVDIDYTSYPAPDPQANAACLGCHDMPATATHLAGSNCKDCHAHDIGFAHNDGIYSNYCLDCHTADHNTAKQQSDWVVLFAPGPGHTPDAGYPVDTYATCSMCHATNVLGPHSNDCSLCHNGASPPRDSFDDWNQSCQQASCHASYHGEASASHNLEYYDGQCYKCHENPSFNIPWTWDSNLPGYVATADACGVCHSLQPDTTPPTSQSDLQASYVDEALITITAQDAYEVSAISYNLNGTGPQVYGGPITVAPPASGTKAHSLTYWATDTAGNVEPANVGSFTVTADTEPPVTTSNAQALYGSDATIQLTATDNATSYGVAATYYVFDDPEDTPTAGTTAVMPVPASGSEEHTLYFWSVDHAGNDEDPPKSATFTMVAGGTEQTALHLDQTVYFHTAPGASGPWVRYRIYVDDVLKGTLTKNASNTTTTWNCPETPLSAGSHIDIVVDAWLTTYSGGYDSNAPYTYTFTLPAGATRLKAATWTGFSNLNWAPVEYEPGYGDFAFVEAPPSLIENVVYVTTSPDTTAPSTTSNVTSGGVYSSNLTFTLTPSDPGGTGVNGTWWQLDSTDGAWTSGTSVPVNLPVSGTEAHTLYWYSTDYAGNQEVTKSVAFSMEKKALPSTSVSMNNGPAYTDYVWDASSTGASGPWARYSVYLDGVLLTANLNAGVTSEGNASTQKSSWTCPQTTITGAGQIQIVASAGFTTPGAINYGANSPETFTITLPAGTQRLEATNWRFPYLYWDSNEYDDEEGDYYSLVEIPADTSVSNIVYAPAGADITPPATSCDATEGGSYTGDQTFTLSASDAGSGVESSWWRIDGGAWNIGTSIPVAAPAAGTDSYTITWYSRDNAGNQETQQSVTFDVSAAGG